MNEFYNDLKEVLKADGRFFNADGEFLRNFAYECAMKFDKKLLTLLSNNEKVCSKFFEDIEGIKVFDKVKFGWVISNRQFLPDSYTRFKNEIGLVNENEEFIHESNNISLVWPYKDCILEGGQSKDDEVRNEVFYNELLATSEIDRLLSPKVFKNPKKITQTSESNIDLYNDESLVIKGNNLLSISSLLPRFEGKIKCIYIDPPYNPKTKSNTFSYNNSFNRSSFLTFMKNRLEIAKRLLTTDGVLIVAIDKNEQPYLQILIDGIFTEYDSDCITIVHNPRGAQGTNFSYTHEYAIFVTPKGIKSIGDRKLRPEEIDWSPFRNWGGESLRTDAKNCFYPVIVENDVIVGFGDVMYDENIHPNHHTVKVGTQFYVYPIDKEGIERKWRYARQTVEEIKHLLRAKKTKSGYDIELGKDFGVYKTVWVDSRYDANAFGTQLLKKYNPDSQFSFPKSIYNVYDCLYAVVGNDKNAIVLDFFGGSGTTAHAVMMLNSDGGKRKFILCEQMDYVESETVERIKNVIRMDNLDEEFVFTELVKVNQKFIDEIQYCSDPATLKDIWGKIQNSAYISYHVDFLAIVGKYTEFESLVIDDQKRLMIEILDKNMLYLNYSEIEDKEFKISKDEISFNNSFYKGE